MSEICFTVYCHPEPQGSARAFVVGGKARITSDNPKLRPMRSEVTRCALLAVRDAGHTLNEPWARKHEPVHLTIRFFLQKPLSVPKGRKYPSVKPDLDKMVRAVLDALTGVMYVDDGQVVAIQTGKCYESPECIEITAGKL